MNVWISTYPMPWVKGPAFVLQNIGTIRGIEQMAELGLCTLHVGCAARERDLLVTLDAPNQISPDDARRLKPGMDVYLRGAVQLPPHSENLTQFYNGLSGVVDRQDRLILSRGAVPALSRSPN